MSVASTVHVTLMLHVPIPRDHIHAGVILTFLVMVKTVLVGIDCFRLH